MGFPLPSTPTVLTINGSAVSVPQTVVLRRLVPFVKNGVETLSFSVRGGKLLTGTDPYLGLPVTLTIDGTLRFTGSVETRALDFVNGLGWCRTYQCLGLRHRLDLIPHTDSNDGGDNSAYNQAADNQGPDYLAARAGRTVGQVLADALTMVANATAISGQGIGNYTGLPSAPVLPASTVADLAALTLIPQTPVYFSGEKMGGAIEGFLSQWAPNIAFRVKPNGDMRFLDTRSFTAQTLTMGTDPVVPSGLSRDVADCFQRVLIRGQQIAEMFSFDLLNGTLTEAPFAHDGLTIAQAKSNWTSDDYLQPGLPPGLATASASIASGAVSSVSPISAGYGYSSAPAVTISGGGGSGATATATLAGGSVTGYSITAGGTGYTTTPTVSVAAPSGPGRDAGTCTTPSTTTVTVTSSDPRTVWASNFWDQSGTGRQGTIFLNYSAGSSITQQAQRKIVSNTALTAGGTSTLTLDRPLPNLLYDSYLIAGTAKGASDVWTRYALPSWAAPKLAKQSTYPFAYSFASGQGISTTSTPLGTVVYGSSAPRSEVSVGIDVDSATGTVRFARPTFLTAGGSVPYNVRALVPVFTAVNQAAYPADSGGVPQYGGTSYTAEGLTRTLTITVGAWRDPANAAAMQAVAQDIFDSVSPAVVEGTVVHRGYYAPALEMGTALNIAGNGYTTGWEAGTIAALPVLEANVDWNLDGINITTTMKCSNRRAHYSSEQFLHPDRTGLTLDFGGEAPFAAAPLALSSGAASPVSAGGTVEAPGAGHQAEGVQAAGGVQSAGMVGGDYSVG